MRIISLVFLISCGGEPTETIQNPPLAGEEGAVNGPSADNIPIAGDGEIQARISGVVSVPNFDGQVIQFDALAEFEGQSVVVANERYDAPGEFRLVVRGEHESVDIVIYLDVDGDGPSQGDLRYEYVDNPIALNPVVGEVVEISGLEISVVATEGESSGQPVGQDTPLVEGAPGQGGGEPMLNDSPPEVAPEAEATSSEE